jgi:glycosyltransferase involved in cell wall biosynthesis
VRVALCAPYDETRVSGVAVFVGLLADGLSKHGWSVRVFMPQEAASRGCSSPGLRNFRLAFDTFRGIVSSAEDWNVVHANQPHLQSASALLAARIVGARFVVTYHSDLPPAGRRVSGLVLRLSHRVLLRNADAVVFVSQATRHAAGRPSDSVVRVGLDFGLVDSAVARAPPRPNDSFRFVFVGRQTRSKGFFDLLQVVKELARDPWIRPFRFVLVGEVPAEEKSARDRGVRELGGFVEDAGVVLGPEPVLSILASCHALVLPSYREGLPLVVLEAMATGCVPIASDVGGIPEAVADGVTGIVVPPGNVAALKAAIMRLLGSRELTESLSLATRRAAQETFSLDRTIEGYLRLYEGRRPDRLQGSRFSFHKPW